MIDELVAKVLSKVEKRTEVCFFSAFICGIFAHIYALTNHLYNYDELWHTPTGFGTGVQMGRWGLSLLAWITKVIFKDVYTIPVVSGLVSIIMYALVACAVVEIFDIKGKTYAAIVGALVTTFPAVVSRMFYMFTTHYYAIGEVIVVLGVYLFLRNNTSFIYKIVAVMCVVFGTAIYQTAFVTATCIVVGALLIDLINVQRNSKDILVRCVRDFIFLAISMITYLLSNKVALAVTGLKMDQHRENYDTMGQISATQLVDSVAHCYKSFLKAGFRDVYSMNPNLIVRAAFTFSILTIIYVCIRTCLSKFQLVQKVVVVLIIAVLPIAINLVYIMSASAGVLYSIMTFDMVFMLIMPIAMMDGNAYNADINKNTYNLEGMISKTNDILEYLLTGILVLSILSYIWFANGNFLAMQYTNQHDNAYYQTLMTQIKSMDGYEPDMPIAMIGKPVADSSYTRQDMIGDTFDIGGKTHTNIAAYSSWNIMTRVLGYDPEVRDSDEDEEYFRGLEEVKSMPCYPSSGAIKIIDDTIVIKFQEVEDLKK